MALQTLAFVGRIIVGATFVWSGIRMVISLPMITLLLQSKRVPAPMFVATSGAAIEIVLGALLLVSLWVPVVSVTLAIFVVAATVMVHNPVGLEGKERGEVFNVIISNLLIVGGLLALAAT